MKRIWYQPWYNSLWLWRWLPHRLSKRQSLSTTTLLFRTKFTRTIKLNLLLKWLLGSNLSQCLIHWTVRFYILQKRDFRRTVILLNAMYIETREEFKLSLSTTGHFEAGLTQAKSRLSASKTSVPQIILYLHWWSCRFYIIMKSI